MNLIFTVNRHSQDYKYRKLSINVLVKTEYGSFDPVFHIHYQSHRDNGFDTEWYGGSIEPYPHFETREALEVFVKASRKLFRKLETMNVYSVRYPEPVFEALKAMRVPMMVLDERLGEHVKVADAKPAEYLGWVDELNHKFGVYVRVLARDEEEAKTAVFKEFTKQAAKQDGGWTDYEHGLEQWIKAGKPVRMTAFQNAPTVKTVDEWLHEHMVYAE
jgi:uncharacterized protein YfbU (UPF0304 family)